MMDIELDLKGLSYFLLIDNHWEMITYRGDWRIGYDDLYKHVERSSFEDWWSREKSDKVWFRQDRFDRLYTIKLDYNKIMIFKNGYGKDYFDYKIPLEYVNNIIANNEKKVVSSSQSNMFINVNR